MSRSTGSTGYQPKMINFLQPSSSGQKAECSSGSEFDFLDGGSLRMSTGSAGTIAGTVTFTSDGALRYNKDQTITTTGGTITNDGLTVINLPADDANLLNLASPVRGVTKDIVINAGTSQQLKIIPATSASYFGVSSDAKSIVSDSDVRAGSNWGNWIRLASTGTVVWRILGIGSTIDVSLSTAIT